MTSELFFYGLKITAIGVGIVFVVLYFMQILLIVLGRVLNPTPKQDKEQSSELISQVALPEPELTEDIALTPGSEPSFGVLVAISAALAAMMNSRPVNIISIRKDIPSATPWQQAARHNAAERQHN